MLDENLSEAILPLVQDSFPGSLHVRTSVGQGAADELVWDFARRNGMLLVTRDADFLRLAQRSSTRHPFVWIRLLNPRNEDVAQILIDKATQLRRLLRRRSSPLMCLP